MRCAAELTKVFADIVRDVTTAQLACFSQEVRSIQVELGGATTIRLDTAVMQPDINKYLSKSIDELPGKGTEALDQAFRTISDATDGMFLFAYLGVQSFKEAVDSRDIIDAMTCIPAGLDSAYGRILEHMGSQGLWRRVLAAKILLWVCCSTRPLSWNELQTVLSWDDAKEDFVENQRPFKDSVLDLCSPLVEYCATKDTFHVVHFSVREFLCNWDAGSSLSALARQFLIDERDAHRKMATVALASLSTPAVIHHLKVDSMQHSLVRYSTENWCFHLSSATFDSALCKRYEEFVASPLTRSTWITRFLILNKQSSPLHRIANLHKRVHDWKDRSTSNEITFVTEGLVDIQRALIDLDRLPPSADQAEDVSNFERILIVRDLARAFTMARKLDEGIELVLSSLRQARQSRGNEALETAWLLHSLGILYHQQGRTELATDTQRQALEIQEKHLLPNHLDITLTINELGRMARHLGQYQQSKEYHWRALRTMRQVLPERDLQALWTIKTLARTYREAGQVDVALALHGRALEGWAQLLGEDHPHVLWTMADIARCLLEQGRQEGALEMMQKVYGQRERVLGRQHPDTIWTRERLRSLYEKRDKHETHTITGEIHTDALHGTTA